MDRLAEGAPPLSLFIRLWPLFADVSFFPTEIYQVETASTRAELLRDHATDLQDIVFAVRTPFLPFPLQSKHLHYA